MIYEKIPGSEDGRYITVGGVQFMGIADYAINDADRIEDSWAYTYTPYAFKSDGVWVVSENPFREISVGIPLNKLDGGRKKSRLDRADFLEQYNKVYREALLQEVKRYD